MLGRQAILHREGARAGGTAGFRHHAAMADNRARAITAAVKEHQYAVGIAARRERPFRRNAANINGL